MNAIDPACYVIGEDLEPPPNIVPISPADDLPPFRPDAGPHPITLDSLAEAAGEPSAEERLRERLRERRFNHAVVPPRPLPLLKLGGKIIATPGNLQLVQAPAKAGKSAVVGAIIAAVVGGPQSGRDTLGFEAENVFAKALLHLDTEQSRFDHDALIRRSLARAGREMCPDWLVSHCLTDMDVAERLEALRLLLKDAAEVHGGVHLVIVDGVADLCADPNDPAEAFALVGDLHTLAIKHDCAILTVLHENPGSETGKTRGHLGSQLERKVETPLRLAKDAASGVTTIWSDRARHCHIPREDGSCFAWSDEAGMHLSVGSVRQLKASAKQGKFRAEAEGLFGDDRSLNYAALVERITDRLGVHKRTAERRVVTYQAEGAVIKVEGENYTLRTGLPAHRQSTGNLPACRSDDMATGIPATGPIRGPVPPVSHAQAVQPKTPSNRQAKSDHERER